MFAVLAALLIAAASCQQTSAVDSLATTHVVGAIGAKLDSAMTGFAERGFAGTVLVVRDRQIALLKGYGDADAERGIPNTPATRFEQNSITKMFTAVSVLQLAAAGRLRLDDRLEQYFGEFPADKRDATVDHLLAHTSGLVVAGAPLAGDSRAAFVNAMKLAPREAPAGTQYRYTNAGYSLLAALIERVSGQPFEVYVRRNDFEPAGMRTCIFRNEVPARDSLFARGRAGTPGTYQWGTRGAGGAWCTVGDVYRWIVAVEDSVVIPASMRPLLFGAPKPPSQETYGWHVRRTRIDKGGGSSDFASHLLYYPKVHVVIVWANNDLRQIWRQELNRALSEIILQ